MNMDTPPRTLKVSVTQEDIANGVRGAADKCPIALAVKRTYGDEPTVGNTLIIRIRKLLNHRKSNRGEMVTGIYHVNARAANFIVKFDGKGPKAVAPTTIRFKLRRFNDGGTMVYPHEWGTD